MVSRKKSEKALKLEDEQLCDYELVFIISPEAAEEKSDTAIEKVSQFITGQGGTIADVERWGKRKLAYPIRHFMEGNYVLIRFKLKSALGKELEANLRISEDILRHLLIRVSS